ncbi:MAG: tyrosine-type recombinase/integrase [Phocaeicola sp.]
MRRKKIKLNFIQKVTDRRKYAKDLMLRLCEKLYAGWNPWIEAEQGSSYITFKEVIENYRTWLDKMYQDDNYREDTMKSYKSYLKNLVDYNASKKIKITYIYQFDKDFVVRFLDEVYINRDNTAYTHDNYLAFIKSFSSYCLSKNYLKVNPTEGIRSMGKRNKKKQRTTLPQYTLDQINDYLSQKNKYVLLASYILYYCFIRPKEMAKIKLSNFNLAKQTIHVPDTVSKNRKDGVITLPTKVIHLMVELGIFNHPNDYFLFSDNFKPGSNPKSEKIFRDYWSYHVRKDLKLPDKYKFYSLKDTGITNMLRHYDVLSVRDQARHSSILMTDIYTPHDIQEANELIKNYNGNF